jgi:hypothetical protein
MDEAVVTAKTTGRTLEVFDQLEGYYWASWYAVWDAKHARLVDAGKAAALVNLSVTKDSVMYLGAEDISKRSADEVVIDRYSTGRIGSGYFGTLWDWYTAGYIYNAVGVHELERVKGNDGVSVGDEISVHFVNKLGGKVTSESTVGENTIVSIGWKESVEKEGFVYHPVVKLKLMPDANAKDGYTVSVSHVQGDGIAKEPGEELWFHERDGNNWLKSKWDWAKKGQ